MFSTYPSVAFSLYIILAGFPTTTEWSGTSKFTKLNGGIMTSFPIFMFPTITAFVPIQQLFPIVGVPALLPRLVCPMVTPVAMLILSPKIVISLMIIRPVCPI